MLDSKLRASISYVFWRLFHVALDSLEITIVSSLLKNFSLILEKEAKYPNPESAEVFGKVQLQNCNKIANVSLKPFKSLNFTPTYFKDLEPVLPSSRDYIVILLLYFLENKLTRKVS